MKPTHHHEPFVERPVPMTHFTTTETGPADAPAVVFVHGFMGSAADFADTAARLANRDTQQHRCVCVDLPGHGGAPMPHTALSMPALAQSLRDEVLVGLERPLLVGYSMGGRLALQTALDHPEAVGGLVLVSTSPGIADSDDRERRRARDGERAQEILADFSGFLHAWYKLPIFGGLAQSPHYPAMLRRRLQNDPEAMARVIVELSPGRQPSNWSRLDALEGARWIVGDEDPKYRAVGRQLQRGGHDVIVCKQAAHAVHVERSDWLADQLS